MKYLITLIFGFILIGFLMFFLKTKESFDPTYEKIELSSSSRELLYIYKKNWGSDHQLTLITNSIIDKEDLIKDNINIVNHIQYKGIEPFVYLFEHDSLFIITRNLAKIPNIEVKNITIIQKQVTNIEYVKYIYSINQKKSKFKKI